MFAARPVRSYIALFTLVALIFCYTASAAHAYLAGFAAGTPEVGVLPCHGPANELEGPLHYSPSPCVSAQAVGERFQPALAHSPLPPVVVAALPAPARASAPLAPCVDFTAPGASPPLRLLHCRLLN